jgi:hypothetical protein
VLFLNVLQPLFVQQIISGCAIIVFVVGQGLQDGLNSEGLVLSWVLCLLVLCSLCVLRRIQRNLVFLNHVLHYLRVNFYFLVRLVLVVLLDGVR